MTTDVINMIDNNKKMKQISGLREKVYEQLKQMIITLTLPPGQVVNEGDLSEMLNVSKTPVREALTQLQQDRLVELLPRRGYLITHLSLQDIQEIYETRLILEKAATALAAKRASDDEVNKISRYLSIEFPSEKVPSFYDSVKLNIEFHMEIAQASHNERLVWHLERLYIDTQRVQYMDLTRGSSFQAWSRDHEQIIDALQKRDEKLAESVIEAALIDSLNRLLRKE